MTLELLVNPSRTPDQGAPRHVPDPAPVAFHRRQSGYAPTELRDASDLAELMGVGRVWLKLETERFGLPAFKILGASWAAERLLAERGGHDRLCLVTATDGNHGRAVARVARTRGLGCRILVPHGTTTARIEAIAAEGARVDVVDGDYDEAVRRAAALADDDHAVVADTAWPGYDQVPRWIVEGYATIFAEATEQLRGAVPDVALIPIGVGSLAIAAARAWPGPRPRLAGFEPAGADAAFRSIRAGTPVEVPGPHESIMAGLNCGSLSLHAFPVLQRSFDAFCSIGDELAEEGMRRLAELGIEAGEVSGGAVGCALAASRDEEARRQLGITPESSLFLLLTEGVTDQQRWDAVVGSRLR